MIQNITRDDPYISRMFECGGDGIRTISPYGPAWLFEARRRWLASRAEKKEEGGFLYETTEPTWAWHHDMLEELDGMKTSGDMMQCSIDRDKINGIHVFASSWELTRFWKPGMKPTKFNFSAEPNSHKGIQAVRITNSGIYFQASDVPDFPEGSKDWEDVEIDDFYEKHYSGHLWTRVDLNTPVLQRLVCKMQALLGSKVLQVTEKLPPRQIRRRTERTAGARMDTPVKVVTWRKTKRAKGKSDDDKKEWDKHFWIKGHVRAQWHSSTKEHKPIYIAPHIHGDPEAPLYLPPVVNVVRR